MNHNADIHCADWEAAMAEVLFGGATTSEAQQLQDHLATCPACAEEFRSLEATLEITASRETSELISADRLAAFQDRVLLQTVNATPGLAAERPSNVRQLHPAGRLQYWSRRVAAVAAVLLVGVMIGRSLPGDNRGDGPVTADVESLESIAEQRAFAYLDRSKTLLLGVANFSGSADDVDDLNLPRRSEIAQGLLHEASYLKTNLSDSEQQRLKALVAELEVILLQLAHLDAQADIPALEIMQAGVDNTGLLFKIDVEKMRRDAPAKPRKRDGASA